MARIRSVKPEICESETVARISAEVERTFVRLWTHCDDHGRAKDDPRLITAALFPLLDDVTAQVVDDHLWTLAAEGLVVRYQVDGKRFLACPSWSEHQHPQRPRDSKLPAPSEGQPVPIPEAYATCTRGLPEASGPVVVVGEVEVGGDVEGEVAASTSSQDYTGTGPVTKSNHAAEAPPLDGDALEQAIRKTATLIGRSEAADIGGPGLAATITKRIVNGTDGGVDRERIEAALRSGSTPEAIAGSWSALGPLSSPADAEAVRDAARRREAESQAKLAAIAADAQAKASPATVRSIIGELRNPAGGSGAAQDDEEVAL